MNFRLSSRLQILRRLHAAWTQQGFLSDPNIESWVASVGNLSCIVLVDGHNRPADNFDPLAELHPHLRLGALAGTSADRQSSLPPHYNECVNLRIRRHRPAQIERV